MSRTETCGRAYVKYKGPFDWDGLYKLMVNWMKNKHYVTQENQYKEKKLGPNGNEVKFKVTGKRKETSYTRIIMELFLHGWDMAEHEVVVDGEKKKMNSGRFSIEITSKVEFDWQNTFTGSPGKEIMGKFYDWVMKRQHELLHIDVQEYQTLELEHEIKKFLKMETDTHAY
ncbi:MAG: hypothetical protein ABIB43_00615 [archaeon]